MLYVDNSGAYLVEGDTCVSVGVSAKDKVVERRELESLSLVRGNECDLPSGATPASLDEIVRRFNVSEHNPLKPAAPAAVEDVVDPGEHTKSELEAMASDRGISVPSGSTKAEIASLINES